MSQLILRSIIRNILIEARGPLAFIPILKEWIEVAAKHGFRVRPKIQGPNQDQADSACLQVPQAHSHKVFDNASPDLQEYILKHWRSEEYFAAMIEGVMIGIIRQYEKPTWAGLKSGTTNINGAINEKGEKGQLNIHQKNWLGRLC